MNLFVTDEKNDTDLAQALGSVAICCPIPHGDVCWFGVGDGDTVLRILSERKRIGDMVNSVIGGRYLYQLQAAHDAGFDVFILIVEGTYRSSPEDGILEVPAWLLGLSRKGWKPTIPAIAYSRFCQYLLELDHLAGVIVLWSRDVQETAAIIQACWVNFQTAPSKHNSLHSIYTPPSPSVLLVKPSLLRRIAKELDGVGWGRSKAVAEHFQSVRAMVMAPASEWQSVDGIGKTLAHRIFDSLG